MATPRNRLAKALEALKEQQTLTGGAIRSQALSRTDRELLVSAGFLQLVMKGWYIPAWPESASDRGSTSWYANFWNFCVEYLNARFGELWSLSPEQSLLLQAGNRTVPKQLMVRAPSARNSITKLIHGSSIVEVRAAIAQEDALELLEGLRVFNCTYALVYSTEKFFFSNPVEARVILSRIKNASELLPVLLKGEHQTASGRLAGAFRNIGRDDIANEIMSTMQSAGYQCQEKDPFKGDAFVKFSQYESAASANRIQIYWLSMRETVLKYFPPAPGIPEQSSAYLAAIDEAYTNDAYHSLSIEGYQVTEALIRKVMQGDWNPDLEQDKDQYNAMAAKGYWEAFQVVKASIMKVFAHENAGLVAQADHGQWYRALFSPSVSAGILEPSELAGYRSAPVYIKNSRHIPMSREDLLDSMPALFNCLAKEPEAAVRAVLGHWLLGFIHPYMDGNGRMARFLMNVMLASGGYSWITIPVSARAEYMQALETASVSMEIDPFAKLLANLLSAQDTA